MKKHRWWHKLFYGVVIKNVVQSKQSGVEIGYYYEECIKCGQRLTNNAGYTNFGPCEIVMYEGKL